VYGVEGVDGVDGVDGVEGVDGVVVRAVCPRVETTELTDVVVRLAKHFDSGVFDEIISQCC